MIELNASCVQELAMLMEEAKSLAPALPFSATICGNGHLPEIYLHLKSLLKTAENSSQTICGPSFSLFQGGGVNSALTVASGFADALFGGPTYGTLLLTPPLGCDNCC
eukprot:scaffold70774_cov12-Tisochrysis_lutea.AAC.1